jgi:hypothetical protein
LNTTTQTVTGNVFAADGGPPSFIFCEPTGAPNTFACQGAGPCMGDPCADDFVDLGVVTLPADFFSPPGSEVARVVEAAAGDGTARAAMPNVGFRETPDGEHVLVSSDVGDERWAIALNRNDRTLTGNVFFPGGGDPAFVSCQQALQQPDTYDCYGAGPCVEEGCNDQYTFISTVTLPGAFFGPAQCGNGRVEGSERCEAGTFCLVICGVDTLCLQIGVAPLPKPGICSDDCGVCFEIDF